ncbi:MAG: type II toxin-antitoxin system RelE/ParE family toxin [Vulcanimicrobiota bacterium]
MKLLWTPEAEDNLNEICDVIALNDGDAAERFFYSVVELAQSTVDYPEIGRVVPEYKRKDLRERIHKKYQVRIVYWLRFDTILVVAVYRCSQSLPESLI